MNRFMFVIAALMVLGVPALSYAENDKKAEDAAQVETLEEQPAAPEAADVQEPTEVKEPQKPARTDEDQPSRAPQKAPVKEEEHETREAQGETEIAAADSELPDDFFTMESAGLYKGQIQGALGDDAWEGSSRAEITKLIQGMPLYSQSPAQQKMIDAVLLGAANTQKLDGARDVTPGDDLLILRMNKLLDAGHYRMALDQYSALPEGTRHANLVKAGVLAMLGSGENSTACLEAKIYESGDADKEFWDSLRAYCDYTFKESLSEETKAVIEASPYPILQSLALKDGYTFLYQPAAYDALSKFEQTLLISEQAIGVPPLDRESIAALNPAHLSALIMQPAPDQDQEIRLKTHAAEYNLVSLSEIRALYKAYKGDSLKLPRLYVQISETDDDAQRMALMRQMLTLKDAYTIGAYFPFAAGFANDIIPDPTPAEMSVIAPVMYKMGKSLPSELVQNYIRQYDSVETISSDVPLLLAVVSLDADTQKQYLAQLMPKIGTAAGGDDFFVKNVIENLDNQGANDDNADKVYEKDFTLPSKVTHAMPTQALWDRLNKAGQSKVLGETVLLSIYALNEMPVSEYNPGFFNEVESNLNTVGLTDISRDLAIEGLLGMKER